VGPADEDAALGAHELGGLAQHDLDVARVLAVLGGEGSGVLAGRHLAQSHGAPLGLRDRFVSDHDHVVVGEIRRGGGADQRAEVVAGEDLGQTPEREDGDRQR
jgi:hypothetical protein